MKTLKRDNEERKLSKEEWEEAVEREIKERGDVRVEVYLTRGSIEGLSSASLLRLIEGKLQKAKLELLTQLEARGLWRSEGGS